MSIEQKEETENSKKLLNRKTKRENNINNNESSVNPQLPLKNEIMCSTCLDYERFSTKCYKCIPCNSYFHLDCYNLFIFSENEKEYIKEDDPNLDNFKCSRCREEEKNGNNTKITCHLCVEHSGILKHLKDNLYIHHYCYVFFKDKLHQIKGGKGGKCNNCKIKNIPIFKCESSGCKNKFHIKCALEKGLIFSLSFLHDSNQKENLKVKFDEKIPFFCEVHGKESIENYSQYITAMTQSMDDKKGEPDNKPLKGLQNENDKINNDLNKKDKENNNDNANSNNNQKNEENEKEKPINSISSNSIHGDNYGSNLSDEASEKTPVNHYRTKEKDNSISSNNNISNDNNNVNKNENNDIVNENRNNESKKEETLNNENNENNEEEVDIMVIEDDKNENKENKNENSNNGNNSKNDIEDFNSSEIKDRDMDIDPNEGENELEEYKPPEIKHEIIDLFENFNNMNKDYCFPGSFFKFKNIC